MSGPVIATDTRLATERETVNTFAVAAPSAREMLIVAFRHKHVIAMAFLLPVLVSLALAFAAQKSWQADGKIMVRAGREYMPAAEGGEHNATPPSGTMQEAIDTEVQILTSKDVLRDVAAAIGAGRLYPALMKAEPEGPGWRSWLMTWAGAASVPGDADSILEAAVRALGQDMKVRPVKLSNVIEISVQNPDRAMAAETLEQVLTVFRAHHVAAFSRQRGPALDEQMTRAMAETVSLEQARTAHSNTSLVFAAGEQRTALIQQRAHATQESQEVKIRRAALEEQARHLGAQLEKLPRAVTLETHTQPSPASEQTERALQELKAKEGLYVARFNPGSAILRDLRAAIASHEAVLAKSRTVSAVRTGVNPVLTALETQHMTIRTELAPLAGKEADLAVAIARVDDRLRDLGTAELTLLDLDRRIAQANAAMATLRQRLEDARFADDLDRRRLTSLRIIETPFAPRDPIAPRKTLYLLAGLGGGLVAGIGAFLLALTFRNRFLSVEMTERVLGLPVFACLPLQKAPRAPLHAPLRAPLRERGWFGRVRKPA